MRTNQKERQNNARSFYNFIKSTNKDNRFAIIFKKSYSKTNPNIIRSQMIATQPSSSQPPCIIAESILGYSDCFYQFLKSIGINEFSSDEVCNILHSNYIVMTPHDREVLLQRQKLENQLGFEIDIIDNYVMLLERKIIV